MSRGLWNRFKSGKPPAAAPSAVRPLPAAEDPDQPESAAEFEPEAELHVCCMCGALLGDDFEDEIDGEGPGQDICGDCNRTKNFEMERGW